MPIDGRQVRRHDARATSTTAIRYTFQGQGPNGGNSNCECPGRRSNPMMSVFAKQIWLIPARVCRSSAYAARAIRISLSLISMPSVRSNLRSRCVS